MTQIPVRRRVFYLYNALRYRWDGLLDRLGLYRGAATPHMVKRRVVAEYAARYGARYFVETGTYLGDMTAAMRRRFERLFSVELSEMFYEKAVARFALDKRVTIVLGDSAAELGPIVAQCGGPTLFWLDAHASGGSTARGNVDTPIVAELETIFRGCTHDPIVLIDDARCFVGADDYPTIDEVRARVERWRPDYSVTVERDIIRIAPGTAGRSAAR